MSPFPVGLLKVGEGPDELVFALRCAHGGLAEVVAEGSRTVVVGVAEAVVVVDVDGGRKPDFGAVVVDGAEAGEVVVLSLAVVHPQVGDVPGDREGGVGPRGNPIGTVIKKVRAVAAIDDDEAVLVVGAVIAALEAGAELEVVRRIIIDRDDPRRKPRVVVVDASRPADAAVVASSRRQRVDALRVQLRGAARVARADAVELVRAAARELAVPVSRGTRFD
eukprot:CAMPEP_0118899590 /NCGR_PEP_ID=MMETSP1166-20130328/6083_1 /TAXON_ID=1104430 /ORGANISM="Chrysoreinhardia sp, Strain CCMP3193" /LENGTH=220 /DNA_ID=CAMNT_0006838721 /DNA_START=135 /DNA_END=797 /DNA_ORIENTATION=-